MSVPVLGYEASLRFARSPIFFGGKNDLLSNDNLYSMNVNISVYDGLQSAVVPVTLQLSKDYAINKKIVFEVAEIVRSSFDHDFDIFNSLVVINSPTDEVQWVKFTGDWTYSNAGSVPEIAPIVTSYIYATDGWSNKFNPTNASYQSIPMAVPRKRRSHVGGYDVLPVQYDSVNGNLLAVTYTYNSVTYAYNLLSSGYDNTSLLSNNKVLYLPVGYENLVSFAATNLWGDVPTTGDVCIGFYDQELPLGEDFPDPLFSLCVEYVCVNKYEPVLVGFVNRYGVADFMYFYKASSENEEYTREQYNKSIYQDPWVTPSLQDAKYQDFNSNARVTWTLNSDWVEQDFNDVIEDILMSERVSLYLNNQWIAAQPQETSYQRYKEVNDGLINHTLSFKIAFDQRTLIR